MTNEDISKKAKTGTDTEIEETIKEPIKSEILTNEQKFKIEGVLSEIKEIIKESKKD